MNKNIILTIVLFLAFVVILVSFDLPSYSKFNALRGEVGQAKNSLKEKEELLVKVNQLKQVYDSRKEAIDKTLYVLPDGKDTANLIVQLEALASENGLILENIGLVEKVEKRAPVKEGEVIAAPKAYKTLRVSLDLYGSYTSFKSFLKAIEYNVRIMDIQSINFSSKKGEGGLTFNFKVDLETYYR